MKDLILIALGLIIVATGIWFLWPGGGSKYATPGSGWIVYECDDGDSEICLIKHDGSGFINLTNNSTPDSDPAINIHGKIVYFCGVPFEYEDRTFHLNRLCTMNIDGSGQELIPIDDEINNLITTIEPIALSDSNIIVTRCKFDDLHEVCSLNTDGSNFQRLTENTLTESHIVINSREQLVFGCGNTLNPEFETRADICEMNIDGSSFMWREDLDNYEAPPMINDHGKIVSHCMKGPLHPKGLCVMDFGTKGREILFEWGFNLSEEEEVRNAASSGYDIDNQGTIIYGCYGDVYKLCRIDIDGEKFSELASDVHLDGYPQINKDGLIVYICENELGTPEICVINSDGSGHRVLTGGDILSPTNIYNVRFQ